MKAVFVSSLFVLASFARAADPSISGKWQVHTSVSGNESDMACTFAQKDDAFTGACIADAGTLQITGQIKGNKVTWSYKSEYNGTAFTAKYDGTLDSAAKMSGSVDIPEFGAGGDFTATQAK